MNADTKPKNLHSDDVGNKIFVGGIARQTNEESLRGYFSRFGELEDVVVMYDRKAGRNKGFGYVRFHDPSVIRDILLIRPHVIDGKAVDVKECLPRSVTDKMKASQQQATKIFVGGLSQETENADLIDAFSPYGTVVDAICVLDPNTNRKRGFGFVSFESAEIAKQLVDNHYVQVKGRKVELKALDGKRGPGEHPRGGFRGGRGGRGGWGGGDSSGEMGYGAPMHGAAPYGGGYGHVPYGGPQSQWYPPAGPHPSYMGYGPQAAAAAAPYGAYGQPPYDPYAMQMQQTAPPWMAHQQDPYYAQQAAAWGQAVQPTAAWPTAAAAQPAAAQAAAARPAAAAPAASVAATPAAAAAAATAAAAAAGGSWSYGPAGWQQTPAANGAVANAQWPTASAGAAQPAAPAAAAAQPAAWPATGSQSVAYPTTYSSYGSSAPGPDRAAAGANNAAAYHPYRR